MFVVQRNAGEFGIWYLNEGLWNKDGSWTGKEFWTNRIAEAGRFIDVSTAEAALRLSLHYIGLSVPRRRIKILEVSNT